MAQLDFKRLVKRFGDVEVLRGVDLSIRDGEMVALLGPSGCGKTTMLRLAAGFERPTSGAVYKGEQCLSDDVHFIPPEARNMGIVFQSYALWPNMSVAENIAYPLKLRKLPKEQIQRELDAALATVSLQDHADAEPATLSGGQRQRVALARCLVMAPDAVLLDEPLANLDAHLRETMQRSFTEFHRSTQATMIYVTHDQAEAMAMADRIAVMFDGRIAQLDSPQNLYARPATEQVARFIGQGECVHLNAAKAKGFATLNGAEIPVALPSELAMIQPDQSLTVCIRPEHMSLCEAGGDGAVTARVASSTFLGERYRLSLVCEDGQALLAYSDQRVELGEIVGATISKSWALLPS